MTGLPTAPRPPRPPPLRRRAPRNGGALLLLAGALLVTAASTAAQPLEGEAPAASRDPEMLQLVTFLDQRIENEDPSASPEARRSALLDSLEMMGIAVPPEVRENPGMALESLAGALRKGGTPEEQEERQEQVAAIVHGFEIPPWVPPREPDAPAAVAALAGRLREGGGVAPAYRPRPKPVSGLFRERAALPGDAGAPPPDLASEPERAPTAAQMLGPSPAEVDPAPAPALPTSRLPPGVPEAHAPLPPPTATATRSTGDGRSPLARRIEALRRKLRESSES